jgi:hypothetical protein
MTTADENRVMGEVLQKRNRMNERLIALCEQAYAMHEILLSVSFILKSPENAGEDQTGILERMPTKDAVIQTLTEV